MNERRKTAYNKGLALFRQDIGISTVVPYPLRFRLDVHTLALVLNFNLKKILASVFG